MLRISVFLLAAVVWAGDPPEDAPDEDSSGQASSSPAAPRPAAAGAVRAPLKLGPVTLTGILRSRLYAWNWFEAPPFDNLYAHSGNLFRLSLSQKRAKFDWAAEFAIPVLLGLPDNATATAPQGALGLGSNYYSANKSHRNAAMIFPKQLFLRLRVREGQSLQVGRFLFLDGAELAPKNATLATLKQTRIAQRLLGDFGWTDVGRSFDGLHYAFSKAAEDVTFVAAVPTRGVFQVDGWGWNQAAFAYGSYTRDWGKGQHAADTRFFFLEYGDWRTTVLKTDSRPLAARRADTDGIRIDTFGGHSLHAYSTAAGTWDVLGWGLIQTGRWGTLRHRAYALAFEGGFQPKILPALKPWLRGGYNVGSGDGNPNDSTHGSFFQALPTPRPFARFPFFNMMNTQDRFASLILRPHPKVTLSSEFHSIRLSNANDLWYSGGGVFQPWTFGYAGRSTAGRRSLANLIDTSFEYRFSRAATFSAYAGYAQGLASIQTIYPAGARGQFGYLELLYRF